MEAFDSFLLLPRGIFFLILEYYWAFLAGLKIIQLAKYGRTFEVSNTYNYNRKGETGRKNIFLSSSRFRKFFIYNYKKRRKGNCWGGKRGKLIINLISVDSLEKQCIFLVS